MWSKCTTSAIVTKVCLPYKILSIKTHQLSGVLGHHPKKLLGAIADNKFQSQSTITAVETPAIAKKM
ncbi:MAG: hypothetical protein N2235_03855 [Fischerella sp.]|nr:hypothetical protein [Fischerella sp.]